MLTWAPRGLRDKGPARPALHTFISDVISKAVKKRVCSFSLLVDDRALVVRCYSCPYRHYYCAFRLLFDPLYWLDPQAGLEKISGRLSNNCGLNSAKPQISGRRRLNKNP